MKNINNDLKRLAAELRLINNYPELATWLTKYKDKKHDPNFTETLWNIITDYDDAWNVEGRPTYETWTGPYSKELYDALNAHVQRFNKDIT